jgi:NADPH-dependent stearoyl-CoA 9-desaturase
MTMTVEHRASIEASERIAAFGRAIDEIRHEVEASLGAEDVAHIVRIQKISRRLEVAGRGLIYVSVDPVTFGAGVLALWAHKQLEAIELGHAALHGTYDHLEGAEDFHADKFEWRFPVDEASWRYAHNVRHHQYTNVVGKDPDLRFGITRLSERIAHRWFHALQPASSVATWFTFGLAIQLQSTGMLDLYLHRDVEPEVLPNRDPETVRAAHRAFMRKLVRYYGREYVMFPLLAGPFFPKVLLGNLIAEIGRNFYSGATIYCGHIDAKDYPEGTRARGRGVFYAMQAEAAHDFEVPLPISILCGGLDRQIEHHLFPKLPPNRLREIAPRVRAACEAHGVEYRTGSWPFTLKKALRTLRGLSARPDTKPKAARAEHAAAATATA